MKLLLSFTLIIFYLTIGYSQEPEIHYQSILHRYSNWKPINDSLVVSFPHDNLDFTIKISLITGEWGTIDSHKEPADRFGYYNIASINSDLSIGASSNNESYLLNGGCRNIIDTVNILGSIFATDSLFLSLSSSPYTAIYSYDGIQWDTSTVDGVYISGLEMKDAKENRIFLKGNWDILFSYDYGLSFQTLPYSKFPQSTSPFTDYALLGDSGVFIRGSQGFYSSDLGNTWSNYNNPANVESIERLRGDSLLGLPDLQSNTVKLSLNHGATWADWFQVPTSNKIEKVFMYGDTIFLADKKGVVWKSEDNGSSFEMFLYPSFYYGHVGGGGTFNGLGAWRHVTALDDLVIASGDDGKIIVSQNQGFHFDTLRHGNISAKGLHILKNHKILASLNSKDVMFSTDTAKTWSISLNNSVSQKKPGWQFSSDYNSKIVAAPPMYSKDGGESFFDISQLNSTWNSVDVSPFGLLYSLEVNSLNWVAHIHDTLGNRTTLDSIYDLYIGFDIPVKLLMLSDTHGWFIHKKRNGKFAVRWTEDAWLTSQEISELSMGNPVVSSLQAYSPSNVFIRAGSSGNLLYHSTDTAKTWALVDDLYLYNYAYSQSITGFTVSDTNSYWMTKEHYLIKRQSKAWPSPTVIGDILAKCEINADSICIYDTVSIKDISLNGPTNRLWNIPPGSAFVNGTNAQSKSPSVYFSKAGHFDITLTSYNSKDTSTITLNNAILVDSVPKPTISVTGHTLKCNEVGFYYQWFKNGSEIPNAKSRTLTISSNGDYQVQLSSVYCKLISEISSINNFDIEEEEVFVENIIYPNPASQYLNVDLFAGHGTISLVIYDLKGRKVLETALSEKDNVIDIRSLAKGIYTVKLLPNNSSAYQMLIVK